MLCIASQVSGKDCLIKYLLHVGYGDTYIDIYTHIYIYVYIYIFYHDFYAYVSYFFQRSIIVLRFLILDGQDFE